MTSRKKVTVVTCAYNEAACVDELARRLAEVFDSHPDLDFEVLAIENGSEDATLEHFEAIAAKDDRFRIIELSRNFGFDGGLAAGLSLADGDAVVLMAADLQDPPEVIPELIARWQEGYENVYGLVASRPGSGWTAWMRRVTARWFYSMIARLAEHPIPPHARDFRLLDRAVYEQVRDMREQMWFLRGVVAWTGFRSIGVEFDEPPRYGGRSNFALLRTIEFAIRAIFAHSLAPLRLMPVAGFVLVVGSFFALVGLSVNSLVDGVPFPGFGTIVALISLFFGILFCFLSVIGIYIGLIFDQVRARPSFVIRREIGK